MPNSLSDWVTSLAPGVVLLIAGAWIPAALWWERRRPSSFTLRAQQAALEAAGVDSMEEWHALPTAVQEDADTASLDLAEQAELDAVADAREAAEALVERAAVINALTHP